MRVSATALSMCLGLFVSHVAAAEMDVREAADQAWQRILAPLDVCVNFPIEVHQVNLIPGSEGGRAFECRFYS
ncbi:hypothetical protein BJX99DRAFT_262956 [Aspergillus californicus]